MSATADHESWSDEFDRRCAASMASIDFPSGLATPEGTTLRDGWAGLPDWWRNDLLHAAVVGAAVSDSMRLEAEWGKPLYRVRSRDTGIGRVWLIQHEVQGVWENEKTLLTHAAAVHLAHEMATEL